MVAIEETIISPLQQRAIDYCDKKQMPKIGRQIAVIAYMHGATDQREIDIKKAQETHCRLCSGIHKCRFDGENYIDANGFICTQPDIIKNAMMED